ncbi:hypothetical protein E2C01_008046 [Portunus trituberculatus]|uniref:Uncharacterized protein n=1 Tax=Portunus trituberculatus TaxID=210409 RepID=A0A5B7D0L2_PORTR|nr:hypothetical protein [Portunus trituberculatus]
MGVHGLSPKAFLVMGLNMSQTTGVRTDDDDDDDDDDGDSVDDDDTFITETMDNDEANPHHHKICLGIWF